MSASASPHTPRHGRHPSNIDLSFASPLTYGERPGSRRSSKGSMQSPVSPNHISHTRSGSMINDGFGNGLPAGASNGLGNLADELADAWDDEEVEGDGEDDEPELNFQEVKEDGPTRDSGVDISTSPAEHPQNSNLTAPTSTKAHRRQGSEYDGSEYGDESDLDTQGLPPALLTRMDMVESLARRGTENSGTDRDTVVKRVIEGLKDLGAQSGVEGGATRLITAHSALSTHLLHQSRLLQSLSYPLFSPLALPPDEQFIDDLIPVIVSVNESMPRPTTAALDALSQLHGLTSDLAQTLNYLSDTLHMSRQTTTIASRRLRSARELVIEMRKEEDAREEGERWLTKGNWSERLGRRECAGVCRDVVGGFEEVCNDWRARLVAQAEAVS
ncbi:hypothetical protein F5884DRAFT_200523 [Xylogone sp. PMI_703]|nr:hypothetical protein F5884DRAFT_200523 [Xylogone sp. PMI_703]